MCTAITFQSKQGVNFFGRTMDFSYPIEPKTYIIPKNYVWHNVLNGNMYSDSYSFIAIGQESDEMLGFFDGVNERGFASAVLYFPGYAKYQEKVTKEQKEPVAALDFLHYILGKCGSIDELDGLLRQISLFGVPDPITQSVAPLHWIATDRSGKSVVIESTEQGIKLYRNPIGVLTNSPDFPWHMTNLRNYMTAAPRQEEEVFWGEVPLRPFGQAGGTVPLPGGDTSPERFVRTAYQKTHVEIPSGDTEAVITCFHLMENVTIPRGVVETAKGDCDDTKYTAFINTKTCEYFFRTYDNSEIACASLWDRSGYSKKPVCLGDLARPVSFHKIS
ncbi:putative protein YxeI [Caprobacter fermentans]|uniref:Choloylglycine hydrolase family protein n=1 Tax=Caproicibacter fermentans TaxID=2576756 RepID=A0A6N8HVJ0_9FIRM|nr:choloylglycine hydrolase family protein [Caproicibacter fermentans]MVB09570.1 putative protein YxeI [Caproicibacter fermentans]QNK41414.1 choloylglycine hydrolase family protein [Caproicibacter fermentans]